MSSPIVEDYYALLGVHAGADGEELRAAWRQLAAQWHPDRAGESATAMFQRVSAAYEVLSDPLARAAYDRRCRLSRPASENRSPASAKTHPTSKPAREPAPAIMLSRLCGPLASLLACGRADLDEPGFITLVLGEADAKQGGMITISMPVEISCPECAGQNRMVACKRCGGRRIIDELFSAWLAVPPGVKAGDVLIPSAELPGMVEPVRFRVRLTGKN